MKARDRNVRLYFRTRSGESGRIWLLPGPPPICFAARHPLGLLHAYFWRIKSDNVRDVLPFNFGLLVAYIVPGFVVLWGPLCIAGYTGMARHAAGQLADRGWPALRDCGFPRCRHDGQPFRWAVFDTIHHATGIRPPTWTFEALPERLDAFQALIEIHYRYYQRTRTCSWPWLSSM